MTCEYVRYVRVVSSLAHDVSVHSANFAATRLHVSACVFDMQPIRSITHTPDGARDVCGIRDMDFVEGASSGKQATRGPGQRGRVFRPRSPTYVRRSFHAAAVANGIQRKATPAVVQSTSTKKAGSPTGMYRLQVLSPRARPVPISSTWASRYEVRLWYLPSA